MDKLYEMRNVTVPVLMIPGIQDEELCQLQAELKAFQLENQATERLMEHVKDEIEHRQKKECLKMAPVVATVTEAEQKAEIKKLDQLCYTLFREHHRRPLETEASKKLKKKYAELNASFPSRLQELEDMKKMYEDLKKNPVIVEMRADLANAQEALKTILVSLEAARVKDAERSLHLAEAEKINEEEVKTIQDRIDQVDEELKEVENFENNKEIIENKLTAEGLDLELKLEKLFGNDNEADDTILTDDSEDSNDPQIDSTIQKFSEESMNISNLFKDPNVFIKKPVQKQAQASSSKVASPKQTQSRPKSNISNVQQKQALTKAANNRKIQTRRMSQGPKMLQLLRQSRSSSQEPPVKILRSSSKSEVKVSTKPNIVSVEIIPPLQENANCSNTSIELTVEETTVGIPPPKENANCSNISVEETTEGIPPRKENANCLKTTVELTVEETMEEVEPQISEENVDALVVEESHLNIEMKEPDDETGVQEKIYIDPNLSREDEMSIFGNTSGGEFGNVSMEDGESSFDKEENEDFDLFGGNKSTTSDCGFFNTKDSKDTTAENELF